MIRDPRSASWLETMDSGASCQVSMHALRYLCLDSVKAAFDKTMEMYTTHALFSGHEIQRKGCGKIVVHSSG